MSSGAVAWDWDFDSPNGIYTDTLQNTVYSYSDTGTYIIELVVTNTYGCTDTAYNTIRVIPEYAIYVPNAFTPNNNDGLNQMFIPKGVGFDPDNFEMQIFDRWGIMIFKTTDINKGWDGKVKGGDKVAQMDTYVWKINTKDAKGNDRQYIGHVTIVK